MRRTGGATGLFSALNNGNLGRLDNIGDFGKAVAIFVFIDDTTRDCFELIETGVDLAKVGFLVSEIYFTSVELI
jgi:hypothetical protein